MVSLASRARTSLSIAGALGTIIAATLLSPTRAEPPQGPGDFADDGWRLEARLASSKILPGALEHDLAITIRAPVTRNCSGWRPPRALAIVIDRSGSMTDNDIATPMSDAKAAAARIVAALGPDDAFSVVAYSAAEEGVQVVHAMSHATAANKDAARRAIATIEPGTGTCISCGITQGVSELERSPLRSANVRRMVLISDGQPTDGLRLPDELVELAAQTAEKGMSISTVGVGLEFDELTMQRIANVGQGNYYFVEDTKQLGAILDRELQVSETIARDIELAIVDAPGTEVVAVYNHPHSTSQGKTIIPISAMREGESRKVVVRVKVMPTELGELVLPVVRLSWRPIHDTGVRAAQTTPVVEVVDDPAEVAAAIHTLSVVSIEEALTARALDEAADVVDTHGSDVALQVLERRAAAIRANAFLPPAFAKTLEQACEAAAEAFRSELPGRAKKVTRVHSYELAR